MSSRRNAWALSDCLTVRGPSGPVIAVRLDDDRANPRETHVRHELHLTSLEVAGLARLQSLALVGRINART
jgi:hypothetical protein